ncbi:MAG: hypothetical protein PHQ79_05395 [Bacilli bacterium]|nr:hypothetical protein [Bacilli bacterium]MDD4063824.1 hypothetical protein [Bacilli bacterium]
MIKRKELKDKIKNDIYQSTPDVFSKIKLDQIAVDPYQEKEINRKKFKISYKHAFSSLITLVLVFVVVVLIAKPRQEIIPEPVYNYSPLDSSEEVYAVSSVIATNLFLASFSDNDNLSLNENANEMLIDSQYDNLNKVLNSIESLINNKQKNSIVQLKSDDNNYEFLLEISSVDLMMFEDTYYLYYNVVEEDLSLLKFKDDDNGRGKDDDEEDDEDYDKEHEYEEEKDDITKDIKDLDDTINGVVKLRIEGKIIYKNNPNFNYIVEGMILDNKNIEKIVFDVYEENNLNNYIRIIQSENKDKQIFIFEEFSDAILISKNYMVLKVDEDNDYSADLIVVDLISDLMSKYEISKDFDDNEMEIEYLILFSGQMEEGEIEVNIIKVGNQYQYNYKTKNEKGNSDHKEKRFRFSGESHSGEGPLVFTSV